MKNIKTLFFLAVLACLLFSVSSAVFALEAEFVEQDSFKIKQGHPQQYTVKEGDTLWSIADIFLTKPWYWSDLWKSNKGIKNPDLIYPGDVLTLTYVKGKASINRSGRRTVYLSPEVRAENLDRAIPVIPLDLIAPYLTKNRILNAGEYATLPYIVGIYDGHLSAGANNSIYVMGMPEENFATTYGIYRRGEAYEDPLNKKSTLGYEAIYLGEASLKKGGSPATLFIKKSKTEILKGHRIIPIDRAKIINASFHPKSSLVQGSAQIVGVLTLGIQAGVSMVGETDVVIINAGVEKGVEIGDVFNIYKKGIVTSDPIRRNKQVKLPDEINGNLMVFRLFNRMSYAIVMDAQSTLRIGDVIRSPYSSE